MKRGIKLGISALILIVLFSSLISADILFTEPTKPVYNLGDIIYVPVTIKTLTDVYGTFQMDLICNGTLINFYKNGVKLFAGEEKKMDSSLVLINSIIKGNDGICKVKASLNSDYQLSEEFQISNWLNIDGGIEETEFNAGESFWIDGKVKKESGENSDGFVEVNLMNQESTENLTQKGTITKGVLHISFSLPENLKAGDYIIRVNAYEKDSEGIITNNGFVEYNILVKQVPTNLELVMENDEIEPGTAMKVKVILHDQTGDPINTTAHITIKNSEDRIMEQKEIKTDLFFEYPIYSKEPPARWKVYAVSKKLDTEKNFEIKEKEGVNIEIFNKTILITNIGNIFYNKTVLIKIGETPLNIQAELKVGETKKYILSAPNGEYQVRVATGEGEEVSEMLSLTGNAIGIKEASWKSFSTFAWIFFVVIFTIGLFFLLKKLKGKRFSGHLPSFKLKKREPKNLPVMKEDSISSPVNKAELSLSIKGNKQESTIVCLKIKNLKDIETKKSSATDTIKKIKEMSEENKAVMYDNQNYLLFILAPAKTKTFKNERPALDIAEKMQNILLNHNRMFSQKIEFGISLNKGDLIGKIEDDTFKFMGMGSLITMSKRLASLSNEEILLGEKINDLLRVNARTDKETREGTSVYVLKSIKRENEETRKFINKFLNKQEKEE